MCVHGRAIRRGIILRCSAHLPGLHAASSHGGDDASFKDTFATKNVNNNISDYQFLMSAALHLVHCALQKK